MPTPEGPKANCGFEFLATFAGRQRRHPLPLPVLLDGDLADGSLVNGIGGGTASFFLTVEQSVPHGFTRSEYNPVIFPRHVGPFVAKSALPLPPATIAILYVCRHCARDAHSIAVLTAPQIKSVVIGSEGNSNGAYHSNRRRIFP
jgi:hypothetical protein